ncbi:mechanosensitive ion channel family protein [Halocalculus aciditolerans]|uniref:Mechanosensitive ion channel MscS domain-containing protein n=1 Tax=Halocalculus aciditolerans TaxID=1383812 RepID=A0A830FKB1_9EURY|nr:mechanosensitive ion channel family protein [Halocalculus aciditolerans]GGL60739.1 hypothetical protein GCM10009039_18760 [Halocalculus aciditolerans]
MKRRGLLTLALATLSALAAGLLAGSGWVGPTVYAYPLVDIAVKVLLVAAVISAVYGGYGVVLSVLVHEPMSKRRRHKVRSVVQLVFIALGVVAVLGALTDQWVPALVSLGVAGFAITFALQQPLLSLFGWIYIMVKEPYQVGDRVAIEGQKGDIIDVDFLATTLWEVNGELVSTNQPSGRHITIPNSVVLSQPVTNFSRDEFPYVWNEISFQVAFETDLAFTQELLCEVAEEFLGAEMEANIERYQDLLEDTPVELEVAKHPSVNVKQQESWVELRLRYLTRPKQGQKVKNELYARCLDRLNDNPERVAFPVSRNR